MAAQLNPLPLAATNVRVAVVGDVAQQLIFPNPDRRFYLIQNQDAVDSIELTSVQGGSVGQIIGPTGAKIVDAPSTNAVWARNITSAAGIRVTVEEIVGYSPYEIRLLNALETLVELLAMGGKRNVR